VFPNTIKAEILFLQQTKVIACNTCTACNEAGRGNSMSCDVKPESCEERLGRRRKPAGKGRYIEHDKKKIIMHTNNKLKQNQSINEENITKVKQKHDLY
jgi:hypothetical protein